MWPRYYDANIVAINEEIVGLAPGTYETSHLAEQYNVPIHSMYIQT
jgi:hypothetical protein